MHKDTTIEAIPELLIYGAGYEYRATWEAAQWNIRGRSLLTNSRVSMGITRTRDKAVERIKKHIDAQVEYAETGVWPMYTE